MKLLTLCFDSSSLWASRKCFDQALLTIQGEVFFRLTCPLMGAPAHYLTIIITISVVMFLSRECHWGRLSLCLTLIWFLDITPPMRMPYSEIQISCQDHNSKHLDFQYIYYFLQNCKKGQTSHEEFALMIFENTMC